MLQGRNVMDTFDNPGGGKDLIKESGLTYDQKFNR